MAPRRSRRACVESSSSITMKGAWIGDPDDEVSAFDSRYCEVPVICRGTSRDRLIEPYTRCGLPDQRFGANLEERPLGLAQEGPGNGKRAFIRMSGEGAGNTRLEQKGARPMTAIAT